MLFLVETDEEIYLISVILPYVSIDKVQVMHEQQCPLFSNVAKQRKWWECQKVGKCCKSEAKNARWQQIAVKLSQDKVVTSVMSISKSVTDYTR